MRAHGARGLVAILFALLTAAIPVGTTGTIAGATTSNPVEIGLIVPIIADAGDGFFLDADELDAAAAPGGEWFVLTEMAKNHGLTVVLDTRIVASIDELGLAVPESVSSWLAEVELLDPLHLPWGNPDLWALAIASERVFDAETVAALSGVSPRELVVWPSGDVSRKNSLRTLYEWGYSKALVSDSAGTGGISRALSDELAPLVSPDSTVSAAAGAESLRGSLSQNAVLTLPRNPESFDAKRAADVVDELSEMGVTFSTVAPTSTLDNVTLSDVGAVPPLLAEALEAVNSDEELVAAITADRDELLANRLRGVMVLSRDLSAPRFDTAAQLFVADTSWLSSVVSISLASEYTVLSNAADVPLSVSNNSDALVTVLVKVRATSAIVQVDTPIVAVTIEPRSNVRIEVPISTVANGRTMLVASLVSESGEAIGGEVTLPVTVQAEWEAVTLVIFGGVVVTILAIGARRTVRRRRAVS